MRHMFERLWYVSEDWKPNTPLGKEDYIITGKMYYWCTKYIYRSAKLRF